MSSPGISKRNIAFAAIVSLAVLHLLVISFLPHPLLFSNIIQLAGPLIAILLCVTRARRATIPYFRRVWYKLGVAFFIWAVAQSDYVSYLLRHKIPPTYPSLTDFLWLLYSFPLLLAASRGEDREQSDWIGLIDLAQACFSVFLLYGVIWLVPTGYADSIVYDIQSVALLFACAIRYSAATSVQERIFFRDLTIYVVINGLLAGIGVFAQDLGARAGGVTDLAWSLPILIFCAISVRFPDQQFHIPERARIRTILPAHIHGIGSLGLALTSIGAGVLLTLHRPAWGIPALCFSCALFALRTAIRESQLKGAQLQLEYESLHDSLTGLANRAMLYRELSNPELSSQTERCLLFLDLDRFKVINDGLGHTFGDKLLVYVANQLQNIVRRGDLVARLGGDEFIILLHEAAEAEATTAIVRSILNRLRAPIHLDGRVLHITASIGIAPIHRDQSPTNLLRHADAAMYVAKSQGRNQAHYFDQSIVEKTTRELELETALRHAMNEEAILVSYQPIYCLKTETIQGFEALARWHHPEHGMISPAEFIPLAEDTGLIIELGKQVLKKACFQIAHWNREFEANLTINVNVSGRQLADKEFLSVVQEILEQSELHPSLLKFEITESVLLRDREAAETILGKAREMGIEICLDDFGTGYSSLSYLLEFPFDTIKIDKGFVQDVDRDEERALMLDTILHLAKNLRKKVVAEGVETRENLGFLASRQCDSAQGFLLSRPLMPESVPQILQSEAQKTSLRSLSRS